jgi:hypothetical protein|eukprot:COSAG06_NODE_774_length_12424_cov_35.268014_11_plen_44_part_00
MAGSVSVPVPSLRTATSAMASIALHPRGLFEYLKGNLADLRKS